MNISLNNIKSAILGAAALLLALPAMGQRQLPAQHNAQHNNLIANHRSVSTNITSLITSRSMQDVMERENLEEIYNNFWESDRVNPYGNIAIPMVKDIDVSEGVVPVTGNVSSRYGWRSQFGRMHRGTDLSLRVGDTVRVAFTGKVRLCKYEGKGYGYYVVVRHDNGMETVYGHLSRFLVKPGEHVRAGQPIALGGNTGRSTGPHLHFETRYLGLAVNPELIFDFEHNTTHKDIYTFDKSSYEKSQVSGPRHKGKSYAKHGTKKKKATGRSKSRRSRR